MVCRNPANNTGDTNEGHIISQTSRPIQYFAKVGTSQKNDSTTGSGQPAYDGLKTYDRDNCRNPGNTFIVGVSLSRRQHDKGTQGLGYINTVCSGSTVWSNHDSKVDSDLMICDDGMAVCALQVKNAGISVTWGTDRTTVDVKIGCCKIPEKYLPGGIKVPRPTTTTTPAPITPPPVNPNPNPNPTPSDGKEGIFNLQKQFLLIWGQVLLGRITRYNYYYTPHTIEKEGEWETSKCADGTFVNGFEVTTPVSQYFWTRRIMQIKFLCAATDGSKGNELDLYKKLRSQSCNGAVCTLQNPEAEFTGSKNCTGGYYSTMEIDYYLDKTRTKLALVNAWELSMGCSKGETHKHLINSTPLNVVANNEKQSGAVDCGSGKAICGFENKITENRKGAFEGLFYKVICCSV